MRRIPLLDLGNVVVQVDFQPFLHWLEGRAKRQGAGVQALLKSSLFYEFEFGQLGREDFAKRVALLYDASFTIEELESAFCGIFPGLLPGMEAALAELAAEGPVYCLSNTNQVHLDFLRAQQPVLGRFTKIFASHEMHIRKPYPGIYQDVAWELGVDPAAIAFFDDIEANVKGARLAGLEAHLFQGAEDLLARLK